MWTYNYNPQHLLNRLQIREKNVVCENKCKRLTHLSGPPRSGRSQQATEHTEHTNRPYTEDASRPERKPVGQWRKHELITLRVLIPPYK